MRVLSKKQELELAPGSVCCMSKGSAPRVEENGALHSQCLLLVRCVPEDGSLGIKGQKRQPHPIGTFSRTHPLAGESSLCGFPYMKWFITPASCRYYPPKTLMLWQASCGGWKMLLVSFPWCVVILRLRQRSHQNLIHPPC